jgi:hypothetical protein
VFEHYVRAYLKQGINHPHGKSFTSPANTRTVRHYISYTVITPARISQLLFNRMNSRACLVIPTFSNVNLYVQLGIPRPSFVRGE